jgi:catechol 2,3-dioxygenase-like lactoylglutathione lyase family enzyme
MSPSVRAPYALEGIDHVLLLINGMQEALQFYRDVLGCRIESELPEFSMVQLRAGSALIDLVDVGASAGKWALPEIPGGRNLDHVCIAITACDEHELRDHLAAHNIKIVEEGLHKGARGNSLSIYIRDPSGNTIELKGPPAPAQ